MSKNVVPIIVIGLGIGLLIGLSVSPVVSIVITSITGAAAAIVVALSGMDNQPDKDGDVKAKKKISGATINPAPMAWLVAMIVIGSISGIFARNQDLFGSADQPELTTEIEQWTDAGLPKEEVVRRLFEDRYAYRGWQGDDLIAEVEKWRSAGITDTQVIALRLFESTYPVDYDLTSSTEKIGESQNIGADKVQIASESVLFTIGATDTTDCDNLYLALKQSRKEQSQEPLIEALKDIESLKELPTIVEDPQTLEKIVTEVLCP